MSRTNILVFWHFKNLIFEQNFKKVLNWLNFMSRIELNKIMCKNDVLMYMKKEKIKYVMIVAS